jgi:uncharacterized protein
MRAAEFTINLHGLSQKSHRLDFSIGDDFFTHYGQSLLEGGRFEAIITLDKRETLMEADFEIKGSARLVCDRSLEPFDFPMDLHRKILFKFGTETKELSDEITELAREQATLDLGQYLYELITVNLPMKRLHPRFKDLESEEEIRLVYSSPADVSENKEETVDPRWEKLKKLK